MTPNMINCRRGGGTRCLLISMGISWVGHTMCSADPIISYTRLLTTPTRPEPVTEDACISSSSSSTMMIILNTIAGLGVHQMNFDTSGHGVLFTAIKYRTRPNKALGKLQLKRYGSFTHELRCAVQPCAVNELLVFLPAR